jgi:hypothetical protein
MADKNDICKNEIHGMNWRAARLFPRRSIAKAGCETVGAEGQGPALQSTPRFLRPSD